MAAADTGRSVAPIDPRSEHGKRIAADLSRLAGEVEDRLAREAAQAQARRDSA